MSLKFDTSKKSKNELIFKKNVFLDVSYDEKKECVYLMTNDFNIITEKLKSFSCRIPNSNDFTENSKLSKNIQNEMKTFGTSFSITISLDYSFLHYLDFQTKKSYSVSLENLSLDGKSTNIIKMFYYACNNNFEEIEKLAKFGCDVDLCTEEGITPLMLACTFNSAQSVKTLLKLGANINANDIDKLTPLMYTAIKNSATSAKILLSNKDIKIDKKDSRWESAFEKCVNHKSNETLKVLLKFCAEKISDEEYAQAMQKALDENNIEQIKILLENSKNPKGLSYVALIFACQTENQELFHLCMKYDCDVNASYQFGMTPLMIACYTHCYEIAVLLLKNNADVNKVDDDGITALMYAAMKANIAIIELLIEHGADCKAKDKNGKNYEDILEGWEDFCKEPDTRTFSQLISDRMIEKISNPSQNKKSDISLEYKSFLELFDFYVQKYWERFPKNKQSDIYRDAGLSKQTFSKIRSNRKSDYRPKKDTIIQLSLGLKLTKAETENLLQSAGYSFSEKDKKDIEIKKLLDEKNYDLFDWSNRIYKVSGKIFFKTLIENDER